MKKIGAKSEKNTKSLRIAENSGSQIYFFKGLKSQ